MREAFLPLPAGAKNAEWVPGAAVLGTALFHHRYPLLSGWEPEDKHQAALPGEGWLGSGEGCLCLASRTTALPALSSQPAPAPGSAPGLAVALGRLRGDYNGPAPFQPTLHPCREAGGW